MTGVDRGEIIWTPKRSSRIEVFASWAGERTGRTFVTYDELWQWSVDDLDGFWSALAEWAGVRWHQRPATTLADASMPGAVWCPGGTLNWSEHALAQAALTPDAPAVIAHGQTRSASALTWAEFADAVARCRTGLRRLGVTRGDRVCAYSPNIPETLIAFAATASLGAIWSSCAPEFGVRSVIDRFSQIDPKVFIAIDGYRYGAKDIDRTSEVAAIEAALPSLDHTVHIRYLGTGTDEWTALLAEHEPITHEAVPFDHPLYVLYSSGTTGLPKAIVHGHGGIVLEHLKLFALHHDLSPGDRFGWFTTTGWVMWNYLVSALLVGGTILMFDGDPGFPDLGMLWRLAAEAELDAFGVSAPFIMSSRRAGVEVPPNRLRAVGSTGAPLPPDGFRWIVDTFGPDVQPCSVSGGTDVATFFVGSAPNVPVRIGEMSCRALGVDARAFDADGHDCPPGVQGELVITQPMPSMPVGFWGDDDGSRFRDAYFADFPGVWRHGDWITFTPDGGSVLSGRSDATLNRGGVRLGTSDFYSVVEELPEVTDSLVVHLVDDPDDAMGSLVLFVALTPDVTLDEDLRQRIASALRTHLSPRHIPDEIEHVPAVPRTLSGKKLEVPVKRILAGASADDVASRSSLADPDALDWFEQYAARR